jgi:uracil-DNA glycosylase
MPAGGGLSALKKAAAVCEGCPLFQSATQTVFGAGSQQAKIILVGEQPGDHEDAAGKPFVGPAGRLLDEVFAELKIDRRDIYLTNVVKHFKWVERVKRRLHAKPSAREVDACRSWLEAELEAIQPQGIVCLGATAAKALLGNTFRLTQSRGQFMDSQWAPWIMATYHPSALLRAPDEEARRAMRKEFTHDLRAAVRKADRNDGKLADRPVQPPRLSFRKLTSKG